MQNINIGSKYILIPLLWFGLFAVHSATLGISDDEAYYWVLSKNLSLSHAFHPPMVSWSIAASEFFFSFTGINLSPIVVRFPALFFIFINLVLLTQWLKSQTKKLSYRGLCLLLSLPGIYGAAWMMVPDLPMIAGWALLWVGLARKNILGLFIGTLLLTLSKYTSILAVLSALVCVIYFYSGKKKLQSVGTILLAFILGWVPILIWNSNHEWASFVYQFKERHAGGNISWIRFLRFWIVQMVLAGPFLVCYSFKKIIETPIKWKTTSQLQKTSWIWALPPFLIFCIQPLYSEFKVHWALIVWLPFLLLWIVEDSQNHIRFVKYQIIYSFSFVTILLLACHYPVIPEVYTLLTQKKLEPKMDVTNDFYGWDKLRDFNLENKTLIASRYQTASQAAFALRDWSRVQLIPRDLKQKDEWIILDVTDHVGPGWPSLKESVFFVADYRYTAPPEFKDANCTIVDKSTTFRQSFESRSLTLWKCDPVLK